MISHNKPAPFATNQFPWESISADDFVCEINDYTLRVEKMDTKHWWWRVYYKGEPIPEPTNEFANSKILAIAKCEGLYTGHSLIRNNFN